MVYMETADLDSIGLYSDYRDIPAAIIGGAHGFIKLKRKRRTK